MSEFQTISINQKRFNYALDPDVTINHNRETIEYFYKTDESIKAGTYETITLIDLNKLADVKLDSIDSVSSCKTDDSSFLVIFGTDSQNIIHVIFYNLNAKTAKHIPLKHVLRSKLTKATITRSLSKVLYRDKRDTPYSNDSYVLVIATQGEGIYLVILSIDESYNFAVQFMEPFTMKDVNLSNFGYVTSICILPSDHSDQRMGHGDPHVILGFSLGHILNFRIRANIYSHKAKRIRAPKDLSRFVEFPGYPITKISCARAYNSLESITAFAQEKPAQLTDQSSYVKLIESHGDGFSEVKKIIQASGSSVDIIESELIPSSTTGKDDQIQLSILFLDHEKSLFTSSIWEILPETITPQPIKEVLHLSMDHTRCVQSVVGRTRTQLDKNKFLTNTPQKVILTILKANESNKREAPSSTVEDMNTKPAKRRKGVKDRETESSTPALQDTASETPISSPSAEAPITERDILSASDMFDSITSSPLSAMMEDMPLDVTMTLDERVDEAPETTSNDDDIDYINDEFHFEDAQGESNPDDTTLDVRTDIIDAQNGDSTAILEDNANVSNDPDNVVAEYPESEVNTEQDVQSDQAVTVQLTTTEEETEQVVAEQSIIEEAVTEEIQSEKVAAEEVDDEEIDTKEVITEEMYTEEMHTEEKHTEEIHTAEIHTEEVHTEEVVTEEIPIGEVNSEEVHARESDTGNDPTDEILTEEAKLEETYSEEGHAEAIDTEEIPIEEVNSEEIDTKEIEVDVNHTEETNIEENDTAEDDMSDINRDVLNVFQKDVEQSDAEQAESEQLNTEEVDNQTVEPEQAESELLNTEEVDNQTIESQQAESEQLDTEEVDNQTIESQQAEFEQLNTEEVDNQTIESQQAESEQLDTEEVDNQIIESQQAESEHLESEQADSEQVDTEHVETMEVNNTEPAETLQVNVDLLTELLDTEPDTEVNFNTGQIDDEYYTNNANMVQTNIMNDVDAGMLLASLMGNQDQDNTEYIASIMTQDPFDPVEMVAEDDGFQSEDYVDMNDEPQEPNSPTSEGAEIMILSSDDEVADSDAFDEGDNGAEDNNEDEEFDYTNQVDRGVGVYDQEEEAYEIGERNQADDGADSLVYYVSNQEYPEAEASDEEQEMMQLDDESQEYDYEEDEEPAKLDRSSEENYDYEEEEEPIIIDDATQIHYDYENDDEERDSDDTNQEEHGSTVYGEENGSEDTNQADPGISGYAAYNRVAEISGNHIIYPFDSSANTGVHYDEEDMNDFSELIRANVMHDTESSAQSMSEVQTQDSSSADLFDKVIPEMLVDLFGTDQLDIEQLGPEQLDLVGNYCWNSSNPQLKLFMLRSVYSRNMYEAVVLLSRALMNSGSLSGDDLEECKSIFRKTLFQVHPFVRSSAPLNPFDDRMKIKIDEQKNNYYLSNNSTGYLSKEYMNYYNFGYE